MKSIRRLGCAALLLLVSGCGTFTRPPPPPVAPPPPPPPYPTAARDHVESNYARMKVYFATDRNRTGSEDPQGMFGGNRGDVSYGTCIVSIPRDHRMGDMETPSIWRLEFREDPSKHVVLLETHVTPAADFFAELAGRIRASSGKNAFVFVHGYNVTFTDAARRTAQMAYDLGFDGAPVFYSWPSRGETAAYTIDEQSVEWAQSDLKRFLQDFFAKSDADNVYLIAHSMGNRALTRATASLLTENPALRTRLKEIILAAPDIDAEVFRRDIAPALVQAGRPITLYASSRDRALMASKLAHGGPRAGDSGPGVVVMRGIETVDATSVDTSLLGHSYYGDARSVLSDIFYLVHDGKSADFRFGMKRMDAPAGRYWAFVP